MNSHRIQDGWFQYLVRRTATTPQAATYIINLTREHEIEIIFLDDNQVLQNQLSSPSTIEYIY